MPDLQPYALSSDEIEMQSHEGHRQRPENTAPQVSTGGDDFDDACAAYKTAGSVYCTISDAGQILMEDDSDHQRDRKSIPGSDYETNTAIATCKPTQETPNLLETKAHRTSNGKEGLEKGHVYTSLDNGGEEATVNTTKSPVETYNTTTPVIGRINNSQEQQPEPHLKLKPTIENLAPNDVTNVYDDLDAYEKGEENYRDDSVRTDGARIESCHAYTSVDNGWEEGTVNISKSPVETYKTTTPAIGRINIFQEQQEEPQSQLKPANENLASNEVTNVYDDLDPYEKGEENYRDDSVRTDGAGTESCHVYTRLSNGRKEASVEITKSLAETYNTSTQVIDKNVISEEIFLEPRSQVMTANENLAVNVYHELEPYEKVEENYEDGAVEADEAGITSCHVYSRLNNGRKEAHADITKSVAETYNKSSHAVDRNSSCQNLRLEPRLEVKTAKESLDPNEVTSVYHDLAPYDKGKRLP
ncbi:hypothetical protein ElyMa_005080700 [Elysia marginata]|uniref:Uncharacterized protein n=1 Tax=Elysia marginata TaxID=1093978 RepID=A0AAV4JF20_9GAST|nr:hypothetical protein ElyMa_005080700 [Elysia marginata]